jgi:alkylhydroperoxidase/carboxymuconolactone decarboxylase family protein YurZ
MSAHLMHGLRREVQFVLDAYHVYINLSPGITTEEIKQVLARMIYQR